LGEPLLRSNLKIKPGGGYDPENLGCNLDGQRLKKAVNFYENILGLVKKYEYKDYAGFDCGGAEIGIKTWGELEKPRKGEPVINFLVTDIKEAFHKLKENGVRIVKEPRKTQWGAKILLFCDPDGNLLQMSEIIWSEYFRACVS